MKSLTVLLASQFFFFHLNAESSSSEYHNLDIVTSWDEYVSFKQEQRAFGIWSYNGKTSNVWDGIPEGIEYNHTFTCQMSPDGSKILSSHVMKTTDGSILSTGSQMETWDPKRQKIFSSASGFDGGELYSGSYELVKINGAEEKWNYTENISAKTYRVIITWETGGDDKRKWTATRSNNPDKSSTRIFKRHSNEEKAKPQGVILREGTQFKEQEQVLNAFVEAFVEGNAEDCSELYSEDTIYMSPETPVLEGRDAVFESYKEFFNNREYEIIEMKEPVSEVINFGDWAVIRGTGMDKIRSTDGKESEKTYKWMILSQRQSDGSWKMKWDIFNYDANY